MLIPHRACRHSPHGPFLSVDRRPSTLQYTQSCDFCTGFAGKFRTLLWNAQLDKLGDVILAAQNTEEKWRDLTPANTQPSAARLKLAASPPPYPVSRHGRRCLDSAILVRLPRRGKTVTSPLLPHQSERSTKNS